MLTINLKIPLIKFILSIGLIILLTACNDDVSPVQNNHLKIYNNDILKNEYVYTDSYQLIKEIKYDTSGEIIESTTYSYSNEIISNALVSNGETEIAFVQYDFSKQDTVMLIIEPQNGFNGIILDYPSSEEQYHSPLDGVTSYYWAYSNGGNIMSCNVGPNNTIPKITLGIDMDKENINYINEYFGSQVTYTESYRYNSAANVFYKFGLIKFDPLWLSYNDRAGIDFWKFDFNELEKTCREIVSYSYEYDDSDNILKIHEHDSNNPSVKNEYTFEYSKCKMY